jgi:fructose-1-phosphate kinase PfkB-like protein
MLTSQIYERIPLKVRKLINVLVVFFKPSKKEVNMIFEEQLEEKDEVANEIYKMAFDKPYDFLMVVPEKQKIYANYDQILLTDE